MPANIHSAPHAPIQARTDLWHNNSSTVRAARLNFDIPDALLAEVDFKWLMAGQGHRVDPDRFYAEQAYTMDLLQTGLRSESAAVRERAAYLLEQIESASPDRWPHADYPAFAFEDVAISPGVQPVQSPLTCRKGQGRQQAAVVGPCFARQRVPIDNQ